MFVTAVPNVRRLLVALLPAALAVAALAAVAGGQPAAGPTETCPLPAGAALTATPNPVAPNATTVIKGSGWTPGSAVVVQLNGASYMSALKTQAADGHGGFQFPLVADDRPGKMMAAVACEGASTALWITVGGKATATPAPKKTPPTPKPTVPAAVVNAIAVKVAPKVIAKVEAPRTTDIKPVPVGSVDPSAWRLKDLKIEKEQGAEWIPTGVGNKVALVNRWRPPDVPIEWAGSMTPLTELQKNAQAPAVVISAHGGFDTANGFVRVPDGVEISTFVPLGTKMDGQLGLHVDTGNFSGTDRKYMHTYRSGDLIPNFTFVPYEGEIGKQASTVSAPTTLNDLIRPGMGAVSISACESVFVPVGQTVEQSLANAPIHTPQSTEVTHLPSDQQATITNDGQLQVSASTASP